MSTQQSKPTAEARPRTVRATRLGFLRGNRIKPGVTFTLRVGELFAPKWMEDADGNADQLADVVQTVAKAPGSATRKQAATPVAGRNSHVI